MKYGDLQVSKQRAPKRVGRGIAGGQGKTAGRGTKGQLARTGSSKRPGFEGGQKPLMQRLPHLRGFRSLQTKAQVIYTGQLDMFANKTVDTATLAEAGLITSPYVRVKVITRGEVTKKVNLRVQGISASALEAVQKAGGSFEKIGITARSASAKNTEKKERKSTEQGK